MNCNDIEGALNEGAIASLSKAVVQEHLNRCARCRKLVAALSQPTSLDAPLPAALQQIERRLVSDLRPVRRTKKEHLLAALAAIFLGGVALGVYRIGPFEIGRASCRERV